MTFAAAQLPAAAAGEQPLGAVLQRLAPWPATTESVRLERAIAAATAASLPAAGGRGQAAPDGVL